MRRTAIRGFMSVQNEKSAWLGRIKFRLIKLYFIQEEIVFFEGIISLKDADDLHVVRIHEEIFRIPVQFNGIFHLNQWGLHWIHVI